VFLDRLESGLLLLQTPQGYVAVQPSFWQRAYLIWTFRNFRQLSPPLLNARQLALVKALASKNEALQPHSYDPLLVIGVVDFSSRPKTLAARLSQSNPEPAGEERHRREVEVERTATSDRRTSERLFTIAAPQPERPKSTRSSRTIATVQIAAGVVLLFISLVVAVHRIGGGIRSLAHNSPAQRSNLAAPSAPKAADSERATNNLGPATQAAPVTPSSATGYPLAGPEAAVKLSAVKTAAITSVQPDAKQTLPFRGRGKGVKPPASIQEAAILATRAPSHFAYPAYSDIGARGEVAMMAQVNSDGTVRSVRVVSGNRALAAVAVRAVRKWQYLPYLKDGQPVATETNVVMSFFSDDAISMSFPPTLPASH